MEDILTTRQRECLTAYLNSGENMSATARQLGVRRQTLQNILKQVRIKLAKSGEAQDVGHEVPPGYTIKGTSAMLDADGNRKLIWVKTEQDKEKQAEIMEAALSAMREQIKPLKRVKGPKVTTEALLNQYIITDYHLGAYAWGEETGADWDTGIAERLLFAWFERAIELAPDAHTAVFAQLGDFMHWDGLDAVTPTSKHLLDADGRFQHVVRVAVRVVRRVIDRLLLKHQRVIVIMAEGNHDIASSMWLSEFFAELYRNEPRVTVDCRPDPYYCVEWGKTSLFYHHGHKKPMKSISDVFAAKFREVFGRTTHSYAHMGHLHHDHRLENNLMIVEQHRTLAAPDSHASRGGWLSGRDSKVMTYHKEYGEVSRVTVGYDMLR